MSDAVMIFGVGACVGAAIGSLMTLLIAEVMTRWG